ncbi:MULTISPECIES: hypothetical protein [unclassified Pseudomonas]|uniref:hypothetical protein n=1 Tax=unclassified Pseudomonas TaxID=196821 RepID=UPI001C868330|nr:MULTISPECIES: hypothetical protein [unclassified Pseudomonas]MBX8471897.1 hypothetical protein [Pseudomonas sp. RIT778]UVM28823.1 hypothetical protein LOY31_07050 [Pseudomonas sp. B21-021]
MRLTVFAIAPVLIFFAATVSQASSPGEGSAGVIRSAEALTYRQLLAQGAESMRYPESCCSLLYSPGTPKSEYHFELSAAYFVRVEVDAKKFAPILFRMSCQNRGFFNPTTECSSDELKNKVEGALKVNYSPSLYGKYRAKWVAKQNGQMLPETTKWIGQDIYSFKRENGIDTIVIGPIKGLPTSIGLMGFDEFVVTPLGRDQ